MSRHAEIAGAGFGGLAAAVALLQRGWSVRVHERTPFVRAEGYGIAVHENGLRVLDALGVLQQITAHGLRVTRLVSRDASDRTVTDIKVPGRTYRLSRQAIIEALAARVAELGGVVQTGHAAVGADAAGELRLDDGSRARGQVIVVADGANSRLRDSLGLGVRRRDLADGALRLVVPRLSGEVSADAADGAAVVEYWAGARRVIYSPCSPCEAYLALSCLDKDEAGKRVPLDDASWRAAFPALAPLFDLIAAHADWSRVFWQRFQLVQLSRWSQGRVAVLGDAAHAMPPNLGQGAGCTLMNALGLAVSLQTCADVPEALRHWERRERPLTEHVQRWATLYGRTTAWPAWARSAFFSMLGRSSRVRAQLERAQRHVPTGTPADGAAISPAARAS